MYLSCTSQSFDQQIRSGGLTIPDFLSFVARDLGIQGVELVGSHLPSLEEEYLLTLRGQAVRLGLSIVNVAITSNFGLPTHAERRAEVSRAVKAMPYARALGSPRLCCLAGRPHGGDRSLWRHAVAALQECCDRANEYSLTIMTENEDEGAFLRSSDDVLRLFGDVNRRNLKLLLNTGAFSDGLAGVKATAFLAGHVHATARKVGDDGSEADINYPAVLAVLRGLRYEGAVCVNYVGDQDPFTVIPRFCRYLAQKGSLQPKVSA